MFVVGQLKLIAKQMMALKNETLIGIMKNLLQNNFNQ